MFLASGGTEGWRKRGKVPPAGQLGSGQEQHRWPSGEDSDDSRPEEDKEDLAIVPFYLLFGIVLISQMSCHVFAIRVTMSHIQSVSCQLGNRRVGQDGLGVDKNNIDGEDSDDSHPEEDEEDLAVAPFYLLSGIILISQMAYYIFSIGVTMSHTQSVSCQWGNRRVGQDSLEEDKNNIDGEDSDDSRREEDEEDLAVAPFYLLSSIVLISQMSCCVFAICINMSHMQSVSCQWGDRRVEEEWGGSTSRTAWERKRTTCMGMTRMMSRGRQGGPGCCPISTEK